MTILSGLLLSLLLIGVSYEIIDILLDFIKKLCYGIIGLVV